MGFFKRKIRDFTSLTEDAAWISDEATTVYSLCYAYIGDSKRAEQIVKKSALKVILRGGELSDLKLWCLEAFKLLSRDSRNTYDSKSFLITNDGYEKFWSLEPRLRFHMSAVLQFNMKLSDLAEISGESVPRLRLDLEKLFQTILDNPDYTNVHKSISVPVEVSID